MANYNNYRKKSAVGSWVCAMVLVLVLVGAFLLISIGSSGFTDWSFSRFFPKGEEQQQVQRDDSTLFTIEEHGITLEEVTEAEEAPALKSANTARGIVAHADEKTAINSAVFKYLIQPAYTTNPDVTVTVNFKTSSAWTNGKTVSDYVTARREENTNNILIKNYAAFGEQIVIKITCAADTSKYATITCDFLLNDISFGGFGYGDIDSDSPWDINNLGAHTVLPTNIDSLITVRIFIDQPWRTALSQKGYTLSEYVDVVIPYADLSAGEGADRELATVYEIFMRAANKTNASSAEQEAYWAAVSLAVLKGRNPHDMTNETIFSYGVMMLNRVYGGKTYSIANLYLDEGDIALRDWSGFVVKPTKISTTDNNNAPASSVVFG